MKVKNNQQFTPPQYPLPKTSIVDEKGGRKSCVINRDALANCHGLTLLELLIVVSILSATALIAMNTLDGENEQLNFSITKQRINNIKEAATGHAIQPSPGVIAVDGFVADMGRLPVSIEELTSKILDCDDDGTDEADSDSNGIADSCQWQYDSASQLWHGWNGPYLSTLADSNNELSFRDGWHNRGSAPDFGWYFSGTDSNSDSKKDKIVLQSLAKDGLANPATPADYVALSYYEQDYPPTSSPATLPTDEPEAIIVSADHEVNINAWKFIFHLLNPCDPDATIPTTCTGVALSPSDDLRIQLYYRQNGQIVDSSWPATEALRNAEDDLSVLFELSTEVVTDNVEQVVSYEYTTSDLYIPWGNISYVLVKESDGSLLSDPLINVSFPQQITLIPRTNLPEIHIYWRLE